MLLLFMVLSTGDAAATQGRLDRLVHSCHAESVVRLIAHSSTEVIIDLRVTNRAPSLSQSRTFDCVLNGMRGMPDLQFGLIGNEVQDPAP